LQQDQGKNVSSLTLMSKGKKRSRVEPNAEELGNSVESEYIWVLVLPSMPKGEIVGKY
jgi:hypothetical protein